MIIGEFKELAIMLCISCREEMNKGRAMNLDEPYNAVSAHLAKVSLNSTDPVFMYEGPIPKILIM